MRADGRRVPRGAGPQIVTLDDCAESPIAGERAVWAERVQGDGAPRKENEAALSAGWTARSGAPACSASSEPSGRLWLRPIMVGRQSGGGRSAMTGDADPGYEVNSDGKNVSDKSLGTTSVTDTGCRTKHLK